MTATPTVTTRAQWAARISTAFRKCVEAVLEQGRLLIAAKDDLDYGDFTAMVESDLPFGPRTAQMLMAIAGDRRFSEANIASVLPSSWTTLYALTRLPDEAFERGIAEGVISPDMIRADVQRLGPEPEPVVIEAASGLLARTVHLDRDGRMTVPEYLEPPANRVPAARAATRTAPRAPTPAPAAPITPEPLVWPEDTSDYSHFCFFCAEDRETVADATEVAATGIRYDEVTGWDLPRICEDCARKSIHIIEQRRAAQ